jgi:hypothetical protein
MQKLWRLEMQIIKPKLIGPKLWATGPLKCFKGSTSTSTNNSSSNNNSTNTTTTTPTQTSHPGEAPNPQNTEPTIPVRDPVYGTVVQVPASQYQTAINTGALPVGNTGQGNTGQGNTGSSPSPSPSGGPGQGGPASGGPPKGETPQQAIDRMKKEKEKKDRLAKQAAEEHDKTQKAKRKAELKKQADALDAKREKELQEKTERETDALDDRSFLEKISDTLYTGDVAAFGNKQKAGILKKDYDDSKKQRGVEEARRLGRPIIIDGKLYKPGMQTPEEAEEEQQTAAELGISVDQLRKEFREEGTPEERMGRKVRAAQEEELAASKGFGSVEEMRDAEWEQSQAGKDPRFGSYEEFQSFQESQKEKPAVGERDPFSVTGAMEFNPMAQQQNRRRLRQDLINYERGIYSADDWRKDYEQEPPDVLTRGQLIEGLGLAGSVLHPAAMGLGKLGSFISSKISDPATAQEAEESLAQDAQDQAEADAAAAVDPRDEEPEDVDPTPQPGGGDAVTVKVDYLVPIEPADPEAPTADELGDQLVKREAQRIREQTLAMHMSQIRALPISAGQKQLMLRRMQEGFDLKFGPKVQDALLKERKDRRDRAEGKEVKSDSKTGQPLWLTGLNAFVAGLPIVDQLGKKFKWWKAGGGYISGPGTETSDSIPARLSDGEFVVKASAVRGLGKAMGANGKEEERAKGVDFLYKLQDGMDGVQKFDNGGEAKKMSTGLIGQLRPDMMGPGPMTDEERSQVTDLKGDPRDIKEGKKRSLQLLMNELGKRNKGMLGKESKGIDKQKVQALLERKNKEIAEKDDLIKKLMQGGKPGKFLDKPRLPMANGGEAYVRPKKAFREAIGYEPESRFHDKAAKDAKFGGARRKFRHFQMGGAVDIKPPSVLKSQFKVPSSGGYGSVVAAQGELMRRIEELERRVGK